MNFSGISNQNKFGRLIRSPLKLIPAGMHVPILQGSLRGWKWIVGSSTHGAWLGSYEQEKQLIFVKTIKGGSVVFDIGAHVGFYALLASKLVGANGKVIAFEPLPRNLQFLKKHLQINNCRNVTVLPVAVGDTTGVVTFEEGPFSSMGKVCPNGDLQVKMVSLDELIDKGDLPPPNYVKMDIEGGEMKALSGAKRILVKYRPTIFLSIHGKNIHLDCCSFLKSCGYKLGPIGANSIDQTSELIAS